MHLGRVSASALKVHQPSKVGMHIVLIIVSINSYACVTRHEFNKPDSQLAHLSCPHYEVDQ